MSDWNSGYVADLGYTFGYYPELNPQRVQLAFLSQGLVCPDFGFACELGFGQGVSAAIHAAAAVTQWSGTDFNPTQAAFAQGLASKGGVETNFFDQAFEEFAARQDLPEFDYIGLHGIWSWISDANREVIVGFIRNRLKVGGVLYISYNTMPGWAAFAPIRHLLSLHTELEGAKGQGVVGRIDGAFSFVDKVVNVNPGYLRANVQVPSRIQAVKAQNRNYVAHEYFNRDWLPMHFDTMAQWLDDAKVQFACSANFLDHVEGLNVTTDQSILLNSIVDTTLRQTTRDFIVNQQFRRDYWVKGARKLSQLAKIEGIRSHRVILVSHRSEISLKVVGSLGEAAMSDAIYAPILDVLADYEVSTIGEVELAVKKNGISLTQVGQAIIVLVGAGYLQSAQDDVAISKARIHTDMMNSHIIKESRGSMDLGHLASPVTGGAIPVNRSQQLFLLAISQGKTQPAEWAQAVWDILKLQGQAIIKDGKTLQTTEENLQELNSQAEVFAQQRLPILKALLIV